jgi:hypothetical protein
LNNNLKEENELDKNWEILKNNILLEVGKINAPGSRIK